MTRTRPLCEIEEVAGRRDTIDLSSAVVETKDPDGMRSRPIPAIDYDDLAAEYARHRRVHPGVLADLVERGRLTPESSVLEVGCGTGNYLLSLHERIGCRCVGVDPSAQMLAAARERASAIALVQGQGEALDFPGDTFDLVYSVDVIHHVTDRLAYFREAARVLKPGGRLCTVTDSAEDIRRRRPLTSHFPETVAVELERYPRISALRTEMAASGFANVSETHVELAYELTDIQPYRDRAFSSLHLIPAEALARGIARLEADLAKSPIAALSLYTLVWGTASKEQR
jgi:ubiquinone/menaquinone biosynthesis C-methylase UbiE